MSVIDNYISKAQNALRLGDPITIDKVAREIVSAFQAEIPHLSSYRGARVVGEGPDLHNAENLEQLIGKLKVLRESKEQNLYGQYGLGTITSHIHNLEDALGAGFQRDQLEALYDRIDPIYMNYYKSYTDGLCGYHYCEQKPGDKQTQLRIDKLRHFRDKELREIKIAEAQSANVSVDAQSVSSASASAHIELSVVIEQIDGLPFSSLSDEEKTTLKGLIADLQTKDSKKREGRLKKLQGWLADKGVDVFIATMPYIVQLIQSQAGC